MKTTNTTKRTPAVTTTVAGNILTVAFSNGKVAAIDVTMLSDTIRNTAIMHGLNAKLVDGAALKCDPITGMSPNIADKYNAVMTILERLTSPDGTWNAVKEGGAGTGANNGLLIRALMEVSGKSKDETEDFIATLSTEQKAALRARERVAAVIARLQREKAGAVSVDADFDSFLGE